MNLLASIEDLMGGPGRGCLQTSFLVIWTANSCLCLQLLGRNVLVIEPSTVKRVLMHGSFAGLLSLSFILY